MGGKFGGLLLITFIGLLATACSQSEPEVAATSSSISVSDITPTTESVIEEDIPFVPSEAEELDEQVIEADPLGGLGTVGTSDPSAAVESDAETSDNSAATEFVELINETRVGMGVPPLEVAEDLQSGSIAHSEQMRLGVCAPEIICHAQESFADEVIAEVSATGENVGAGSDVQVVWEAFLDSEAHYQNLINPAWDAVGVGVVSDGDRVYTTHRFVEYTDR